MKSVPILSELELLNGELIRISLVGWGSAPDPAGGQPPEPQGVQYKKVHFLDTYVLTKPAEL